MSSKLLLDVRCLSQGWRPLHFYHCVRVDVAYIVSVQLSSCHIIEIELKIDVCPGTFLTGNVSRDLVTCEHCGSRSVGLLVVVELVARWLLF